MVELTSGELAALEAIVRARRAWSSLRWLDGMGHGPALESLLRRELVEPWAFDSHEVALEGGPYVTLSPLAADWLGVAIDEEGPGEVPRWRYPAEVETRVLPGSVHPRPFAIARESLSRLRCPQALVSRDLGPAEEAIAAEEYRMREVCRADPATGLVVVTVEPELVLGEPVRVGPGWGRARRHDRAG